MATTIRSGAIFGIGVYGVDNYGVSNVVYIPDGVSTSASVGSVVVSAEANVDIVGVSVVANVGSVIVVADALTAVTGVSSGVSLGSVVVLENEVVDVLGFGLNAVSGLLSVTTTSFDYEAVKELYSRARLVYVEGRQQRLVYVEEQPRKVYTDRRTTADERFALVEE